MAGRERSLVDRISTALTSWKWVLLATFILAFFTRFYGLGDIPLFHDEAYYWVWAQHIGVGNLELNFYDHPVGVAYLIVFSTAIFGDSEFGVRAIFAAIGVITVALVYIAGRYLYDERTGVIAAFLLSVNFGHILISRVALNDVAATLMFVIVVFLFSKAVFEKNEKFLILTGIALGVGFLMKYTMAVLLLGVLGFVFFYPNHRKFVFSKAGVISFSMFWVFTLPFFAWNYMNDWLALAYQGAHASPFLGLFWGGTIWSNTLVSLFFYPMIWCIAISVPLTALLVWGLMDTLKWRWSKEAVTVMVFSFFAMVITGSMGNQVLAVAFELVFIFAAYLCFRKFTDERDGLVAIMTIVFVLFFAFSLGRMFHWTLPALAPLSLLGARLLDRLYREATLTRTQFRTFACVTMLFTVWILGYGVNSSVAMAGDDGEDPKSIAGPFFAVTIQYTKDLGDDTCKVIDEKGRDDVIVMVPNWVTYSPVAYYMHRNGYDNEIYTYAFDVQIGMVWERDDKYMPSYYDKAVIPVYSSSFLGTSDEETFFKALVYDSTNFTAEWWFWNNEQTMFQQTGFDYYEMVMSPEFEYSVDYLWTSDRYTIKPYFIAYAEKRGTENVTAVINGHVYWAPKEKLSYDHVMGPHRYDIFEVMTTDAYNETFGGYDR